MVLAPGQSLDVDLGATPRHALTSPAQTAVVSYDAASVTLEGAWSPAEARLNQPEPTPCFAC